MAKKIDIAGTLNAATTDGVLGFSEQIKDESKGKMQSSLNKEFGEGIDRIERKSDIAYNAVKTLEGLSNANEAMQTLAGQVVQIEENKQNIASNKADADAKLSELGSKVNKVEEGIDSITDFESSKNLLNPKDENIMLGYRQASGAPIATSGHNLTGYINVEEGKSYHFSATTGSNYMARFVAFFPANTDIPTSYVENQHTITVPSGVNRIRLTCASTKDLSEIMVELGDSYTEFEPYGDKYKVRKESLPNITSDKIEDKNVTNEKLSDDVVEKLENGALVGGIIDKINLVDKFDNDVEVGFITSTGIISPNNVYKTTGYIYVEQGMTYYLHAKENNFSTRYVIFFDSNKSVISDSRLENVKEITVPVNAAYIRATIQVSNGAWDVAQITKSELYSYRPYGVILGDSVFFPNNSIPYEKVSGLESVVSSLGTSYVRGESESISANSMYELAEAPLYIKNCNNISFGCQVTSFGSFYLGKGYQSRNGVYVKVTETKVQYIWYYSTETVLAEVEHGLDMSNVKFIRASMLSDYDRNVKVIISTDKGDFVDTQKIEYDSAGKTFVRSESLSATNIVLNYSNSQLKESIWVFGDSYTSLTGDRWTGRLYNNGVRKYLLAGIPGGYSQLMYNDAVKCLSLGTPKYLVWCLGMNDRVSNQYPLYLEYLIRDCAVKGINLVLMKIPQVPTPEGYMTIEEAVNQYVTSSGMPYIDAYSAVGSTPEGTWYDGMLSSDNVHPTSKGAQALASQVLVDFPQLMESFVYDP